MMPIVCNIDPDLFIHNGEINWEQLGVKLNKLKIIKEGLD